MDPATMDREVARDILGAGAESRIGTQTRGSDFSPLLLWPVSACLILYRAQDKRIEIVSVTRGARIFPEVGYWCKVVPWTFRAI